MAVKKKRRRKKAGLVWRVLFGQHGPTKKALKKAFADMVGPKTIASIAHDPATGKLVKKNLAVDPKTGIITIVGPVKTVRKPAAKKASTASQASAPSRASRAGQVPRRTASAPAAQPAARQPRAKPMSERAIRNPDGTLAGSRPAVDPLIRAQQDYEKALRAAARHERRTDREFGWDRRDEDL